MAEECRIDRDNYIRPVGTIVHNIMHMPILFSLYMYNMYIHHVHVCTCAIESEVRLATDAFSSFRVASGGS